MSHLARVPVTPDQIARVVALSYERVRAHPEIGPIFNATVSTDAALWRTHEAKIERFWRNALLKEPVYSGNPMMIHAGISAVAPQHFAIWLRLFDEALGEVLPPHLARAWSALAHRIGRGLSLGLSAARARENAVPDLRSP